MGHGLDVNKRDDMLRTPVIVATTHQQFEVMRLLLERGADASVFEEFQFFRQSYDDGESYSIAVRLFGNRLTASALNETPDVLAGVRMFELVDGGKSGLSWSSQTRRMLALAVNRFSFQGLVYLPLNGRVFLLSNYHEMD